MSLFNKRKLNILNILETAKKVLFSFLLIIFSSFSFLSFTYATNDLCSNLTGEQTTVPNGYVQIGVNCFLDTPATPDNNTGAPVVTTPDDNTALGDNLNVNTLQDNGSSASTDTTYEPLSPLPGLEGVYDTTGDCPLGKYLTIMINLILGIAAVLAMVMIVSGGIQYMGSELISSKEAGKDQIKNAILGLLLALGAYLILNTINPSLLKICLNEIPKINSVSEDEPQVAVNGQFCANPSYADGSTWTGTPTSLPAGVSTNAGECSTVGQTGCTSLKALSPTIITTIKANCANCHLIITGGTECWLHSASDSHKKNSPTVDLRATSSLNTYVTGNAAFPSQSMVKYKNGIRFLAEQAGQTSNTTGGHWHVSM